jgi:acetoin utilization protein AcuB
MEPAMFVRDHMTPRPVTLRADTDFKTALQLMTKHSIHHLPVVDDGGRLLGIVAERDLLFAAVRYLGSSVDVAQVMHGDVVTATPAMPVTEAASLMADRAIGGLPVVDGGGRVVGVITETDIFKAFVRLLGGNPAASRRKWSAGKGGAVATKPAGRVGAAKKLAGRKAVPMPAGKRKNTGLAQTAVATKSPVAKKVAATKPLAAGAGAKKPGANKPFARAPSAKKGTAKKAVATRRPPKP